MSLDPTIEPVGLAGRPTVLIERELPHPIERVWRAVTDPGEHERWFVERIDWTPALGETLDASGQPVRVTRLQEPSFIAWEWGEERYRIELASTDDGGTRMRFQHAFVEAAGPDREHAIGWQIYLGRLSAHLNGRFVAELDAHEQALAQQFDGRPALRFFRRMNVPIDRVWELVSTRDGLAAWFPCPVTIDGLHAGAAMHFELAPGEQVAGAITDIEAPRGIAFDWGSDWIAIDLLEIADGAATIVTFTHLLSEDADAVSRTAAGWHVCLDALRRRALDPASPPVAAGRTPEWERHYDAYVMRGYPSGAPIPSA